METKFYEFSQNNSGGHFDVDENVCHRVVIEATSADHAKRIFEPMIENQSGSCPCCGERWSSFGGEEIDLNKWKEKGYEIGVYDHYKEPEKRWFALCGQLPIIKEPSWKNRYSSKEFVGSVFFDNIEQYYQYLADNYGWTTPDVRIHFLDGTKKEIFKREIDF
jgi:hypothetical protein